MKGDVYLAVIIPVYNEENHLSKNLQIINDFISLREIKGIRLFFCDGGSTDNSKDFLEEKLKGFDNVRFLSGSIRNPSVHASVSLGLMEAIEEEIPYLLICPIDIKVGKEDIRELLRFLMSGDRPDYGAFLKKYSPTNIPLFFQAIYLNSFRLKVLDRFVWTNVPFIKTELLRDHLEGLPDFLDDVYLCKRLLKNAGRPFIFHRFVTVSSRRYQNRGVMKQVMINFIILLGHLCGIGPNRLKSLYRKVL